MPTCPCVEHRRRTRSRPLRKSPEPDERGGPLKNWSVFVLVFSPGGAAVGSQGRQPLDRMAVSCSPGRGDRDDRPFRATAISPSPQGLPPLATDGRPSGANNNKDDEPNDGIPERDSCMSLGARLRLTAWQTSRRRRRPCRPRKTNWSSRPARRPANTGATCGGIANCSSSWPGATSRSATSKPPSASPGR